MVFGKIFGLTAGVYFNFHNKGQYTWAHVSFRLGREKKHNSGIHP